MAWISSGTPGNPHWIITGTGLGVKNTLSTDGIYFLTYQGTSKTFNPTKTYQVITDVRNVYMPGPGPDGMSFSVTVPDIGERFDYDGSNLPSSPGTGNLYFYTSPQSTLTTANYATYRANSRFGLNATYSPTETIQNLNINELGWHVQGFSFFHTAGFPTSFTPGDSNTIGWHYEKSLNSYLWYDYTLSLKYPVGGPYGTQKSDVGYRYNNYISKFINYQFFNLSFTYQKVDGSPNSGISIYLSPNLPSNVAGATALPSGAVLVATMSGNAGPSASLAAFYGLQGGQYVYIVGSKSATSSGTYSLLALSNIKVEGGYNSGNNNQFLMTNSLTYSNPTSLSPIGLTGATYTAYSGYGNTVNATNSLAVYQINALIGNGEFKAGIWENGVWNSGWRDDDNLRPFFSIGSFFDFNRGKQWRFIVNGPTSSVSNFKVGDKVSIGNIVAIDINEDRKLIKNYFTVISVTTTSLIVELTNNFPLRRIEIDSPNHRIYVTKNVWLSGAFLNGYFTGIWNYGLFKGYTQITKMYNSHWIDGLFEGGHYESDQIGSYFSDTIYTPPSGLAGEGPKVGLTFSSPHRLNTGDSIYISKDNIAINPQYNGWTTVISVVNDYHLVTDVDWGSNSTSESGWAYTHISNGVIQNFNFKSNNISTITSVQSLDSDSVFIYNSWIDVNYINTSAVNIGKPLTLVDTLSRKSYSENNLYGWPTNDVLSSVSEFRDSYSLNNRTYRLGTKYKIFNDYIGESSKFEDYFGPTGPDAALFLDYGWTYSISGYLTFSRTIDTGVDPIIGEELKVEALGSGGVLDFNIVEGILNRTNVSVEKLRYSMVEFEVLTYSVPVKTYEVGQNTDIPTFGQGKKGSNTIEPVIHFNNLNRTKRDVVYFSGTYSTILDATYLPIYQNIDHVSTPDIKKYEYFYNKRNLSMYFRGGGLYGASQSSLVIDNLKYYEVDMIPFFKYFNTDNINFGIMVPYQGIAPFIDYTNSNFSFIDNISIGLSSIQTQQSFAPISGVGISIGGGISSGGLYQYNEDLSANIGFNP